MLTSLLIAIVPVMPIHTPPEVPPSGQCAYQEKVNNGLWRCYTQQEYAQIQEQKAIKKEQCEKLVDNTYWYRLLGGIVLFVIGLIMLGIDWVGLGMLICFIAAFILFSMNC